MPLHPIHAAEDCISRAHRLLDMDAAQLPDQNVKPDLRRAALVMAVTAMDSYLHWLVYRRVSQVRYEQDLPKALKRLDIQFSDLASLADSALAARRENHDVRPWVQVKNALQRRLLQETFQSFDQVSGAFALAGVEKGWTRVAGKMGEKSTEPLRKRLNNLVHRRNQIVHEGDIARMSRPQNLRYNRVVVDEVRADVDWVEELIDAIEQVVAEGNP